MRNFLFAASFWWACSLAHGADEWLPLAKGNYWVYRGLAKWDDNGKLKTQTLTWRMEITKALCQGDNLTAAVIKGFPGDLAGYEPGRARSDYLLVRFGMDKYHLLSGDDAAKARKELAGRKLPSFDFLADGAALLIDGPLTKGKHYGEPGQLHRDLYCWVVGAPTPFVGKEIKGLPSADDERRAFPIRFLTNPDGERLEIVSGIGIVSYHYDHHGTISETNLQLVEIHLEKP